MVNKRGFLRILEAVIALVLVISFLAITHVRAIDRTSIYDEIDSRSYDMLEEIAKTPELRTSIIQREGADSQGFVSSGELYDFVSRRAPTSFSFAIRICQDIDTICALQSYQGDLYTAERVIVPSVDDAFTPAKIKLFFWRE